MAKNCISNRSVLPKNPKTNMKHVAKNVLKHPLVHGSSIVVFGGLFANIFNLFFNLYMSRTLPVIDNGTLVSIITIITFPALLANAINPVVIRFAGTYFAKEDFASLRGLYILFVKFLLSIGIVGFLIFFLFISQISSFFHIANHTILILADVIMLITLMSIINIAFLQAKLAFSYTVVINFVNACSKFILGVLFVFLGYSVTGAIGAIVIAAVAAYLLGLIPLKFIFSKKLVTPKINKKELFIYGIPAALTMIGLAAFISTDILLTKHFFGAQEAGFYAGLSQMGKIIFYLIAPIFTVMFPIIVRKHSVNENFKNTFLLALLFTLAPSICITFFYFLFPEFSITFILKRPEYLAITPYLWFYGLYMSLYCLLYLLATFYLSIKKTNIYLPILAGALLQIGLIYAYHDSVWLIIMISFSIVLLLVIGFLLYYPYATKK